MPFAELQNPVNCRSDNCRVVFFSSALRLLHQHFLDIRLHRHTPSARLLGQFFRNVHGNLHGAILTRATGVLAARPAWSSPANLHSPAFFQSSASASFVVSNRTNWPINEANFHSLAIPRVPPDIEKPRCPAIAHKTEYLTAERPTVRNVNVA